MRDGDPEAWGTLYDRLGERVFRLLHRITGDRETALDLTHDTFVILATKGRQYTGRGSLNGWVFRIAANLARDRLRREKTRRAAAEQPPAPPGGDAPDAELRLVLDRAIAELTEEQRAVLLLYDVDRYTHPEIAEMLNIAEGTSKARLSRARARLRAALEHAL